MVKSVFSAPADALWSASRLIFQPTVRLPSSEWTNRLSECQRAYCAGPCGRTLFAKTNSRHTLEQLISGGLRWVQQKPPTCVDIILFMGIVDKGDSGGEMRIPVAQFDTFIYWPFNEKLQVKQSGNLFLVDCKLHHCGTLILPVK